jgi:Fe-S cluster biosynthesis and repair protein YggX
MNPDDRKMLEQEMVKFLFEGHDIQIDGYTPEK